jgi:hypothetical protein
VLIRDAYWFAHVNQFKHVDDALIHVPFEVVTYFSGWHCLVWFCMESKPLQRSLSCFSYFAMLQYRSSFALCLQNSKHEISYLG